MVCFEGASHSKILYEYSNTVLATLNATIVKKIRVNQVTKAEQTRFAFNFNEVKIQQIIDKKCVHKSHHWNGPLGRRMPKLCTNFIPGLCKNSEYYYNPFNVEDVWQYKC